jgi:hypothetical protein
VTWAASFNVDENLQSFCRKLNKLFVGQLVIKMARASRSFLARWYQQDFFITITLINPNKSQPSRGRNRHEK